METAKGGDDVEVGDNVPEGNQGEGVASGSLNSPDDTSTKDSKKNDDDMDTADGAIQDGVDIIDLRPDSDDSAIEDDKDDDSQLSGPSSGLFKKRKLSNSRNYRSKVDVETGACGASFETENENVRIEENKEDPNKAVDERPNIPGLIDSDDSTDSASDASDVTLDDDENPEAPTHQRPVLPDLTDSDNSDSNDDDQGDATSRIRARRIVRANDLEDEGGDNDDNETDDDDDEPVIDADLLSKSKVLLSKKPDAPKSNFLKDFHFNQLGLSHSRRYQSPSFNQRQISSLELVKRFGKFARLEGHEGCVNSLNFNQSGTRIASGSDDLQIIVWDWQAKTQIVKYHSGHRANVFQSKMMPGDLLISSCSRDGQVRLGEFSTSGAFRGTKKLAQHKGPAHKMSLLPDNQYCLLSAGEDGQVFMIDIREQKPDKILLLKNEKDKKVPIYSVHCNPANGNIFCTAGRDHYVRIFDRRFLTSSETGQSQIVKHCPEHLRSGNEFKAHVTCSVFSDNGKEILGSYNDEDIYLFNTNDPEGSSHKHQYQGHRNSATVKGVNFYGSQSEYVVSGSDCGNIFIWDKKSEAIVRLMHGDQGGVVNVLEPHPSLPVLATSGLDDDVKIWIPGPELEQESINKRQEYIRKTIQKNLSDREDQRSSEADPLDGQMLWVLWRHIRRAERRRREAASARSRSEGENVSDNDSSDDDDDDSTDNDDDGPRGRMCTQS